MARNIRYAALETRSARLKLGIRRKPYVGPRLERGLSLHYRRNKGPGTWVVKGASASSTGYWTKRVGDADDFSESDGEKVLTFFEAQAAARKLATADDAPDASPATIDSALEDYATDLISRGANPANARLPRAHLTPVLLSKPIMLLTRRELQSWRNGLLAKLKPASINRVNNSLCAALELARQHDRRIQNRDAWELGLAGLPDAERARNVVISDAEILAIVEEAYRRDRALGLLIHVLATTGSRPGQVVRLRVDDFVDDAVAPKLLMPKSAKGGGRNRAQKKHERYSVSITPALATKLREQARGRNTEFLLVQADGTAYPADPSQVTRRPFRDVVTAVGLDPDVVTPYALRHSSVTRLLLKGVPVRVVAALHNTSVSQIERNYSKHITEHADDVTRSALLGGL
jgi:integrase